MRSSTELFPLPHESPCVPCGLLQGPFLPWPLGWRDSFLCAMLPACTHLQPEFPQRPQAWRWHLVGFRLECATQRQGQLCALLEAQKHGFISVLNCLRSQSSAIGWKRVVGLSSSFLLQELPLSLLFPSPRD